MKTPQQSRGQFRFSVHILMLRWMQQVLKRILHLKQTEKSERKTIYTIYNPEFHFSDFEFQTIEIQSFWAKSNFFQTSLNYKACLSNQWKMLVYFFFILVRNSNSKKQLQTYSKNSLLKICQIHSRFYLFLEILFYKDLVKLNCAVARKFLHGKKDRTA